jgi:PTS system nitrogen regulatory IIA component
MQLGDLLTTETTACRESVASKKRLLQVASEKLASSVDGVTEDEIFTGLLNRERLGSTGIGSGVGIPHCRIPGCSTASACLITLDGGVDFDSIDSAPVDLVCALIVPDDGNDEHLKTLAGLAELFSKPEALNSLRDCTDSETLLNKASELSRI